MTMKSEPLKEGSRGVDLPPSSGLVPLCLSNPTKGDLDIRKMVSEGYGEMI